MILRVHATFSLKRPHFLFISPPGHHLFYTHGQALGCGLLSVYRYGNSVDVGSIHQLDGHSIAAALTPDVSAPPITTHSVTTSSSPPARHYSLSLYLSLCRLYSTHGCRTVLTDAKRPDIILSHNGESHLPGARECVHHADCCFISNFIHQRVIEKKQTKTIYNKQRNAIDMQDYQAVTCKELTKKTENNALRLQKQQMLQQGHCKLL